MAAMRPAPVDDLRRGWDLHVEFGPTHPSFYALMYGAARPGAAVEAAEQAGRILAAITGTAPAPEALTPAALASHPARAAGRLRRRLPLAAYWRVRTADAGLRRG